MTSRHDPGVAAEAVRACTDVPLEVFYSYAPADQELALQVCGGCPLLAVCREWALTWPASHQWGVAGGMTERERRSLLKEQELLPPTDRLLTRRLELAELLFGGRVPVGEAAA